MVKESHLVGYRVQKQRIIWDSKGGLRKCLSVQSQYTNCSFQVSIFLKEIHLQCWWFLRVHPLEREFWYLKNWPDWRVVNSSVYYSKGSLSGNSPTGFLFKDISNSYLFSWKFKSWNSNQLKLGCLTSSHWIWTKRANFKIDKSKYIVNATEKKATDK